MKLRQFAATITSAVVASAVTVLGAPAHASTDGPTGSGTSSSSVDTFRSPNGKLRAILGVVTIDNRTYVDLSVNTVKGKVRRAALVADRTVLIATVRSDDSPAVTKRFVTRNLRTSVFAPVFLRDLTPSDSVYLVAKSYEDGALTGKIMIPVDLEPVG